MHSLHYRRTIVALSSHGRDMDLRLCRVVCPGGPITVPSRDQPGKREREMSPPLVPTRHFVPIGGSVAIDSNKLVSTFVGRRRSSLIGCDRGSREGICFHSWVMGGSRGRAIQSHVTNPSHHVTNPTSNPQHIHLSLHACLLRCIKAGPHSPHTCAASCISASR